jgi:hypothetical protein
VDWRASAATHEEEMAEAPDRCAALVEHHQHPACSVGASSGSVWLGPVARPNHLSIQTRRARTERRPSKKTPTRSTDLATFSSALDGSPRPPNSAGATLAVHTTGRSVKSCRVYPPCCLSGGGGRCAGGAWRFGLGAPPEDGKHGMQVPATVSRVPYYKGDRISYKGTHVYSTVE